MIRFLQTPGPVKKVILSGILLLFCGAMVITLVPGGLGSNLGIGAPGQGVVAKVSGVDISVQEVQREAKQMLNQQFPQGGAQASMLLPFFASRAAENLINQQVVLAEGERLGFRATDAELKDELEHGHYAPIFFPGGNFVGQEAYKARLEQAGLTVDLFEEGVKQEIIFAKLRNLVTDSASVSDSEVRQEFLRRNTKVKFEYAVLSKDDIEKGLHPSDAELKAFYDRNKAAYANAIPEKRKIRYAMIDMAKIEEETPITPDELQTYYNQHRDDFRVPEQVKVSHIWIKTPQPGPEGKVDPKAVEEARKKAQDVQSQLKAGAKFEDLAAKYSDDPGSAKQGGSLSWMGKGRTAPEFEKAAFSLPKGSTSDLVQSSVGFFIIRVDDKQDAHLKSLDEVKAQIEPVLKQQKAASRADAAAASLLTQARANGLEKAAAAKNLAVVVTDFVANTDALPGIGPSPEFMQAIFTEKEKAPPNGVQVPQGFVVFEIVAVKPAVTPTFEEIRARVETEFKNERTGALMSQKMQQLSDRAKAGHDLKKAAQEVGATLKTSEFVLPDGQVPDVGSMTGPAAVAFTMKAGEISGPLQGGNNGIVLMVVEKQEPTEQEFAAKKGEIRDSLLQAKQGELFGMFIANLRDRMEKDGKVKVNQDEMKNLTRGPGGQEG